MSRPVSLSEWPGLIARYAWTRPLAIRIPVAVAVAYTIVVAIDGGYALARWLLGAACVLLGWACIAASRRPVTDIARRQKDANVENSPLDLLWKRLPPGAARRFQTVAGVILVTVGLLFAALSVPAL